MFSKDDIYTSVGNSKLYHCWTDKVTKYDSNTFYNWEYDNLPLHDLDERTTYLWEKMGYPTSTLLGVALVVSADAPDSAIECNKNIFRSLSAAIDAIPGVINFPILIEVANFGSLGEIKLNNIKFGTRGSLEIINRNFAKTYPAISNGSLQSNLSYYNLDTDTINGLNAFNYASGVSGAVSLNNVVFSPRKSFTEASCISISATVFSSTIDARLSGVGSLNPSLYGVVRSNGTGAPLSNNRSTLILSPYGNQQPYNSDIRIINFKAYDYNSTVYDDILNYDASTLDPSLNSLLYYNYASDLDKTTAILYGNKITKIKINNCEGPVIIRNFFLDGEGFAANNEYGIEVDNSNNVYLENMVATRFRKAGIIFNNSNVTLLRSCVSTRNYNFDVNSKRNSGKWLDKIYNDPDALSDIEGAGLVANNSIINVSSTSSMEYKIYNDKIAADTGNSAYKIQPHMSYLFEFSKNTNGIVLNNSTLKGGYGDDTATPTFNSNDYYPNINLFVEANAGIGINAQNSKISFDGRIQAVQNLNGLKLDSSVLEVDKLFVALNQLRGVTLKNSKFTYNKNRVAHDDTDPRLELYFSGNGQHINLSNSKMGPAETSAMDFIYNQAKFVYPIGFPYKPRGQSETRAVPSVEVENGSECVLVSPQMSRTISNTNSIAAGLKGSEILVNNGSYVTLKGTRRAATVITGPDSANNLGLAGVYANNNSTIEINGPTAIGQLGVDLYAENHSHININPHRIKNSNAYDISGFSLIEPANHTAVELHSTRACIVVDKNSTLNIKDLGDFRYNWGRSSNGVSALGITSNGGLNSPGLTYPHYNYPETGNLYTSAAASAFIGHGSLQFYPNPVGLGSFGVANPNIYNYGVGFNSTFLKDSGKLNFLYNSQPGISPGLATTTPNEFSSVTNGGVCVRAHNNSLVNIQNVNFPCGWWCPSGIYYDITNGYGSEGNLCDRLFIWNIADNSKLKAEFISVSGLYPQDVPYFGPSGVWTSGAGLVASGLPMGTPDTSALSVLDYFGKCPTNTNAFGKTAALENYGPFRLYFSVNPFVNTLTDLNRSTHGIVTQVYSQGYQPSAPLIASGYGTYVSSLYTMSLLKNSTNSIVPSGYYYGSGLMNPTQYVNVLLDKSAAELFANAKHCAVGKSGNARLVSIYHPYNTTLIGETSIKNGVGFISPNTFDLERYS